MKDYIKEKKKQHKIMNKHIMDFETFSNQLDEGLIKTYPIDKVVSYVQRKIQSYR